jgi:hypothetical protein
LSGYFRNVTPILADFCPLSSPLVTTDLARGRAARTL